MIQICTQHPIDHMLENPKVYISPEEDEVILKIFHRDVSNPVLLMLGYNDITDIYYFTLEDNYASDDFYCYDGNLTKMFDEIMEGKGVYEVWVH